MFYCNYNINLKHYYLLIHYININLFITLFYCRYAIYCIYFRYFNILFSLPKNRFLRHILDQMSKLVYDYCFKHHIHTLIIYKNLFEEKRFAKNRDHFVSWRIAVAFYMRSDSLRFKHSTDYRILGHDLGNYCHFYRTGHGKYRSVVCAFC